MTITGVRLTREGNHAVVFIEVEGRWVEVIREHVEGPFDHIVNESGLQKAVAE